MRNNNFDRSSSGLNLELSCFRDLDASSRDFEESFTRLQDGLWLFTEFGDISDDFSLSDSINYQFTVKEFKQAFIKAYDPELSQHYMSKPFSKLTKAELVELLQCQAYDSDEIAEFYQDNFKPLYDIIKTRGYCQGDYAEVIISTEYKKYLIANGEEYDEKQRSSISNMIDRLFWDAPIYCRLSVNDDEIEFYLDEHLADLYEWNKDQLITSFTTNDKTFLTLPEDQQKLIAEFLLDNLPDYPDYQ